MTSAFIQVALAQGLDAWRQHPARAGFGAAGVVQDRDRGGMVILGHSSLFGLSRFGRKRRA
jgi:hypothetical protein